MKDKIIKIVQNACALEEEITLESELKLLSLDSLSFVGAVVEIEEEFGVEFELEELGFFHWRTVADIVKNVEEKTNDKK